MMQNKTDNLKGEGAFKTRKPLQYDLFIIWMSLLMNENAPEGQTGAITLQHSLMMNLSLNAMFASTYSQTLNV